MVVIVDTREQEPYEWEFPAVQVECAKLDTGDYSVQGFEHLVAVERKDIDDYVNTIIRHRGRFGNEMRRMHAMREVGGDCHIVVEASVRNVLMHDYKSAVAPNTVLSATAGIMWVYGVPVWFAGDRPGGARITLLLLERFWRMRKRMARARHKARNESG